jgi:protein-L-isoaspartate(D-aspartate) O-methyltransferase
MLEYQLRRRGIEDACVLAAMAAVPREEFVPVGAREQAYADNALPLPHGQTISQPYMVARATELARVSPHDKVLEVGLGSGYQAAVLAQLAAKVVAIDLVPELVASARVTLARLGIHNVETHAGDGSVGFPAHAPYDAIIVSAGAPRIPQALLEQLAVGGRLVIPVGDELRQTMKRVERTASGYVTTDHDVCVYVPLRGASGWDERAS